MTWGDIMNFAIFLPLIIEVVLKIISFVERNRSGSEKKKAYAVDLITTAIGKNRKLRNLTNGMTAEEKERVLSSVVDHCVGILNDLLGKEWVLKIEHKENK